MSWSLLVLQTKAGVALTALIPESLSSLENSIFSHSLFYFSVSMQATSSSYCLKGAMSPKQPPKRGIDLCLLSTFWRASTVTIKWEEKPAVNVPVTVQTTWSLMLANLWSYESRKHSDETEERWNASFSFLTEYKHSRRIQYVCYRDRFAGFRVCSSYQLTKSIVMVLIFFSHTLV